MKRRGFSRAVPTMYDAGFSPYEPIAPRFLRDALPTYSVTIRHFCRSRYHVPMAHQHSQRFLDIVNDAKKRVREVTVDDVKGKLDRDEEFLLVDVREDSEWQNDHLPRALHLGKGVIERDIEQRIPALNAPIVLYCGGGFRSALAADNLRRMGYTNVFSMDGGIREWREKRYPLTKD